MLRTAHVHLRSNFAVANIAQFVFLFFSCCFNFASHVSRLHHPATASLHVLHGERYSSRWHCWQRSQLLLRYFRKNMSFFRNGVFGKARLIDFSLPLYYFMFLLLVGELCFVMACIFSFTSKLLRTLVCLLYAYTQVHQWLLSEEVNLLSSLLLPLAGPEDLSKSLMPSVKIYWR